MPRGPVCASVGADSVIFVGTVIGTQPKEGLAELSQRAAEGEEVWKRYKRRAKRGIATEQDRLTALAAVRSLYLALFGHELDDAAELVIMQAPSLKKIEAVIEDLPMQRLVRLQVDEALQNVTGSQLEVSTGFGGGDCGFPFEFGEQYLVHAWTDSDTGRLSTGICMGTGLAEGAEETLAYLRALPNAPESGRIFGDVAVSLFDPARDLYDRQPGKGFSVRLIGEQGTLETTTDDSGAYAFENIAPGSYRLQAAPEDSEVHLGASLDVKLAAKSCVEQMLTATIPRAAVQGRILDHEGAPVDGIAVELTHQSASERLQAKQTTEDDGTFVISGLEPGLYWASVNARREPSVGQYGGGPYPTSYYPGAPDRTGAVLIEARGGEPAAFVEWRLPPRLEEKKVRGRVIHPDGTPARKVHVSVIPGEAYNLDSYDHTDESGSFELRRLQGVSYRIRAVLRGREVEQPLPDDAESVTLILPAKDK